MLTEEAIVEQIQADPEMMTVLAIIRDLNLADAWLAAGAVRNFIWNQLSGKPGFDATTDMDLVFYDPTISYEETLQIEQELKKTYPQYAWEVKNQVYMHQHSLHRSANSAFFSQPRAFSGLYRADEKEKLAE